MMLSDSRNDYRSWDFIEGNMDMSIATSRYFWLMELNTVSKDDLRLALRDPETNAWTKWKGWYEFSLDEVRHAYDVHRSTLPNEIVIESDYPEYEKNYEATRFIGRILESKGFRPLYYYSGSKSIHIHVFFDFRCLLKSDMFLQERVIKSFKSKSIFVKRFMEWLRELMITCWGMENREFDKNLIKATHLIRAELSRNKKGFKTFLGYTYKDVSFVPYICNEENRIYPSLGELRLSSPARPQELLEEFMETMMRKARVTQTKRREASLMAWIDPDRYKKMRACADYILSDSFKEAPDGFNRAMFILACELKRFYPPEEALTILRQWNERMGFPVADQELEYRITEGKSYTLGCEYIHEFLAGIGLGEVGEKCYRKI